MEYEVRLLAEAVEFLESLSEKLKAKAFRTIELAVSGLALYRRVIRK